MLKGHFFVSLPTHNYGCGVGVGCGSGPRFKLGGAGLVLSGFAVPSGFVV